jgi:hypothetical protein
MAGWAVGPILARIGCGMGERDPGVIVGSNWGVWPLGCTSTHLALIRFPSASTFS